jgi:DNA-binding NarL/FixJ family response regulator
LFARLREANPSTRILVLNYSDAADGQVHGADAYTRKTFRPHELIDAVVSTAGRSVA